MKKKMLIIILIILVIIILGGVGFILYINERDSQISLIQDNIVIEYGQNYTPTLKELIDTEKFNFINKDKIEIKSELQNEDEKDYPAVGLYDIHLYYKNIDLVQKVEVKDTVSPEISIDEKIEIPNGTDLTNYDFSNYVKITDLSDVEKYNIDFSNVDVNKGGEYQAKISVKDKYGNNVEKEFKIVIPEIEVSEVINEDAENHTIRNDNVTTSQTTSKKTNTSNNAKSNTNSSKTTTSPTQNSQQSSSTTVTKPQNNSSQPSIPTQSNLSNWCIEGGKHHIAGDGVNEHGYYSSWNAAHSAFESYTKGWASVQYKISQCPCGLYYFWAIQ